MHNNYQDIINMSHEISNNHPRMSIYNRAAQFAPFAALTGYSTLISESSKIADKKIELYDDLEIEISNKLNYINNHIKDKIIVTIKYYDNSSAKYIIKTGIIKKIDTVYKIIKIDNIIIDMYDIFSIDF